MPYPIPQAQADAVELLTLLSSLPPLLQSACLTHVTPTMSASCGSVEQLNAALREAAADKDSSLLSSFHRAQQTAVERFAQYNKRRHIT